MASQRLFLEICLFSVAMHFAFAINTRTLRKINLRFDKIKQISIDESMIWNSALTTSIGCLQRANNTVGNTLLLSDFGINSVRNQQVLSKHGAYAFKRIKYKILGIRL